MSGPAPRGGAGGGQAAEAPGEAAEPGASAAVPAPRGGGTGRPPFRLDVRLNPPRPACFSPVMAMGILSRATAALGTCVLLAAGWRGRGAVHA